MVEWKKLGEICSFFRGRSLSKKDIGEGNHQILLYGELYTTYGDYITHIKSKTSFEKAIVATKLKYNDLVLPVSSTTKEAQIGKVSVIKTKSDVYLGSDAILLRDTFNPAYLMYYLNSTLFEKSKMECVHGTTIMHLSPTELAQKEIPIPSLSEQSRIVSILDTFTSSISNLKQQIEERRKQFEYEREMLFTEFTKTKTIGELTKVFSCPRVYKDQWKDSGIPFWRSSDVMSYYNKVQNPRGKVYISESLYKDLSKKTEKIEKGDILVTGGGTIGIPYLKKDNTPLFVKDADLICIKKSESIIPSYLYHFFFSTGFQLYLKKITHDATIAHYTIGQIIDTPVPIPSLTEQSRIVSILDTFEQSISNLEEQLAMREKQYEYYRNQLLTFEGEEERGKT
ncbi:MAG: restriction endonuclease subunit S [Bacteroidales bacterium]|nr:restriction endonuclease subunit S [Bacteroidales bacterium]